MVFRCINDKILKLSLKFDGDEFNIAFFKREKPSAEEKSASK